MPEDDRFDGLLLNIAQQTQGIEPLLDVVFGFLRRKTDFYARPDDCQSMAASVVQKHLELYQNEKGKQKKPEKKKPHSKKKPAPKKEPPAAPADDGVVEMNADGDFDVSSEDSKKDIAGKESSSSLKQVDSIPMDHNDNSNDEAPKDPPPVGNGGNTDDYVWTQTLQEVQVTMDLQEPTRGKDLRVTLGPKRLKIVRHGTVLVDKDLKHPIVADDSFWTIEDGTLLVLTLQKLGTTQQWWPCVCQGDVEINVQAIQPETSRLSDLQDDETRQTVEKMMMDQRLKAVGLPTTEEQSKLDILKKFQEQHPEMDFSNAKIG